jgi:carbon starvation protein
LILACVALVKMKRERFLWIAALPTAWLVLCTLIAGWQKVFGGDIRVSFLAHARGFGAAMEGGKLMAPAKTLEEMQRVITNDYVDATLTVLFMLVVVTTLVFGIRAALAARRSAVPTASETPHVPLATAEQ